MLIVPFWWNILRAQHTTCTSESKMHGCGSFRENTAAVLTNHTHYYGIEEHNILCAICVLLKLKVRCIGHMHGVTKTRFTCPWNNFTYSENVRRATDYNSMHTETEHIRWINCILFAQKFQVGTRNILSELSLCISIYFVCIPLSSANSPWLSWIEQRDFK